MECIKKLNSNMAEYLRLRSKHKYVADSDKKKRVTGDTFVLLDSMKEDSLKYRFACNVAIHFRFCYRWKRSDMGCRNCSHYKLG